MDDAPKLIRDFLIYMQTIRGKSPRTVEQYYIDLRMFFRFIIRARGLAGGETELERIPIDAVDVSLAGSVTLTDLYEFLYCMANERSNNSATRARKVSCLRSFYKYACEKTGILTENPTRNLDTPKKKRSLPKHLTLEESMEFLRHIDGDYKERDYCIMTLFLNCGLRLSELCGLNLSDVREETLVVTGKGNKERTVYLNEACIEAINSYLNVRPRIDVKDKNALFLSRLNRRISPKTVQWLVKKNLANAGLGGRGFSTHKLRHTAATLMYQHGGVDIRVLQEILGHESHTTTEIYTHLSSPQLKAAAGKSPLARFKAKPKNGDKKD
ncbi:MAG: tyrosine recombinase XerC [Clostridia bacterium]|nr:tyrosine recombinase XerC [Clostridia bacterium]